jgi:hypothetical protein
MTKYRIPTELLETMEKYEQSPNQTETDDALLIAPILRKYFSDLEALQTATITAIDALQLDDAMVISNLTAIDRT